MNRMIPVALCLALVVSLPRTSQAATIRVNAGGNLQAAIDAAKPGDTIELQPGATFDGPFRLRAKSGMSATSRITIRTAGNSALPGAGTRITPAAAPLLAKIRSTTAGVGVRTDHGAAYWTLLLLEFLPASSTSSVNLVEFGHAGPSQSTLSVVPHHLVIDRCYLHGSPTYGHRRGLALNSGDATIINSHFSDFKGVSQDTQAIMGWNGPGPFLIENNHLEAAGENILFGGEDPNIPQLVPTGITIRRNLITKPIAWKSQSWTVKNLIEFKNVKDVVVEGNIIENNWAAGQQGYSIVFTPRNQYNTAPWVIVKNVTVQNNVIRHVAAVFNILGYDDISTSQQTQDITIRNNLIYDVSSAYATPNNPAPARLAIIGAGPKNITFDHNTVDNTGSSTIFFYKGKSPTGVQITGFELTNNLLRSNSYGIFGDRCRSGHGRAELLHAERARPAQHLRRCAGQAVSGRERLPVDRAVARRLRRPRRRRELSAPVHEPVEQCGTDGRDLGVDFAELIAALNATPAPPPPRRRLRHRPVARRRTAARPRRCRARWSSRTTTTAARISRTTTRPPSTQAAATGRTRST